MTTYKDVERAVLRVPTKTVKTNVHAWEEFYRLRDEAHRAYAMFLEERNSTAGSDFEKAKALVANVLK